MSDPVAYTLNIHIVSRNQHHWDYLVDKLIPQMIEEHLDPPHSRPTMPQRATYNVWQADNCPRSIPTATDTATGFHTTVAYFVYGLPVPKDRMGILVNEICRKVEGVLHLDGPLVDGKIPGGAVHVVIGEAKHFCSNRQVFIPRPRRQTPDEIAAEIGKMAPIAVPIPGNYPRNKKAEFARAYGASPAKVEEMLRNEESVRPPKNYSGKTLDQNAAESKKMKEERTKQAKARLEKKRKK